MCTLKPTNCSTYWLNNFRRIKLTVSHMKHINMIRDETVTGLMKNYEKIPSGYPFLFYLSLKPYLISTIWKSHSNTFYVLFCFVWKHVQPLQLLKTFTCECWGKLYEWIYEWINYISVFSVFLFRKVWLFLFRPMQKPDQNFMHR